MGGAGSRGRQPTRSHRARRSEGHTLGSMSCRRLHEIHDFVNKGPHAFILPWTDRSRSWSWCGLWRVRGPGFESQGSVPHKPSGIRKAINYLWLPGDSSTKWGDHTCARLRVAGRSGRRSKAGKSFGTTAVCATHTQVCWWRGESEASSCCRWLPGPRPCPAPRRPEVCSEAVPSPPAGPIHG